jgi:putative salt-induced outer membrane protein
MIRSRKIFFSLITALPAVSAWADAPPPPQGIWTGKGQAGFVGTQGNTDAKALNAAIDMALMEDPWGHTLHFSGLYSRSADITSAERWDAGWQSNYAINTQVFGFGSLRYEHDLFSGFQFQASGALGLGYKIIDDSATKLSGQVGVGYRDSRLETLTKNGAGEVTSRTLLPSNSNAILTAGLDYSQMLTASTTLSDKLLVESGSSDTLITNVLALAVKMSDRLALSVGYSLQDNSKPPAGLKKVDSVETVNLVYSF